jgi:hypothetical protein
MGRVGPCRTRQTENPFLDARLSKGSPLSFHLCLKTLYFFSRMRSPTDRNKKASPRESQGYQGGGLSAWPIRTHQVNPARVHICVFLEPYASTSLHFSGPSFQEHIMAKDLKIMRRFRKRLSLESRVLHKLKEQFPVQNRTNPSHLARLSGCLTAALETEKENIPQPAIERNQASTRWPTVNSTAPLTENKNGPQPSVQQKTRPAGILYLPLEIRLIIYEYLNLEWDEAPSAVPGETEPYEPFKHPIAGLQFANRQLLNEILNFDFVYYRIKFLRFDLPSQCLLYLDASATRLKHLHTIELTVPASETGLLETIFDLLVSCDERNLKLSWRLSPKLEVWNPLPCFFLKRFPISKNEILSFNEHSPLTDANYKTTAFQLGGK